MHISDKCPVITFRALRFVQQLIAGKRICLSGFISHLRGSLINIDQLTLRIGETHRDTRPGEHPGPVLYPAGRPIIIGRIQPDAMLEFRFRKGYAVRPLYVQEWGKAAGVRAYKPEAK